MAPRWVNRDQVPEAVIAKEREILGEQSQHREAKAAFEHALSLAPSLESARHGIATARRHLGPG